ncbi:unnamed protein product [marine sediment metagenome]|uniref:Uncharacterized protein n=1 Tax=marine sediment metagenome TaxID=412755 RepID=X0SN77_9ZZZZ
MSQKPEYECSGKLSDGCERLDLGWACPKIALGYCPFGVGMGANG